MRFGLEYNLDAHGWAEVSISNGKESFNSLVSYLRDSLSELAQLAIDLENGVSETKVIFMDEPGELQLFIKQSNEVVFLKLAGLKIGQAGSFFRG